MRPRRMRRILSKAPLLNRDIEQSSRAWIWKVVLYQWRDSGRWGLRPPCYDSMKKTRCHQNDKAEVMLNCDTTVQPGHNIRDQNTKPITCCRTEPAWTHDNTIGQSRTLKASSTKEANVHALRSQSILHPIQTTSQPKVVTVNAGERQPSGK